MGGGGSSLFFFFLSFLPYSILSFIHYTESFHFFNLNFFLKITIFLAPWVFIALCWLSSFGEQASHCGHFSCGDMQVLSAWASVVLFRRLISGGSGASFLCGMWNLPGFNLCSLHWRADSHPPGKSTESFYYSSIFFSFFHVNSYKFTLFFHSTVKYKCTIIFSDILLDILKLFPVFLL